jgi:thioesterase domain-containing protein
MVEPRTGTERVIADAWKRALRLDRVGVTDDFFALGGTSIDAVALFGNLRRRFNKPLLPTLLFQAATIERLAAEIDGPGVATDKRFTSLTPIQTSGTRPPLFCVHAGAGTILFYNPIAKALGADQPVYAFQSQGLYGGKLPQASIEAMAAHYISEMRAVQPNGPYRLAGFCLGATLAFEMAVQLQRTGEHVEFLGSFDGLAPRHRSGPGRPDSGPRSALQKRLDSGLLKIRNLRNRALLKYTRRFGGPVPRVFRRFAWYFLVNNHLAKVNYHPSSPFLGALHVFTIKGRYAEPRLGWSQWVNGDVQTIEISGEFLSHRDLMDEPMVSLVAAGVNELLAGSPSNDTARAARRQLTTSGAS